MEASAIHHPSSYSSLKERIEGEPVAYCWDSLMELRSCIGEVVLFFLNRETYLGPSFCKAIKVIEHKCRAADTMLSALGFAVQEGHILKGYCDDHHPPPHHDDHCAPTPPKN